MPRVTALREVSTPGRMFGRGDEETQLKGTYELTARPLPEPPYPDALGAVPLDRTRTNSGDVVLQRTELLLRPEQSMK